MSDEARTLTKTEVVRALSLTGPKQVDRLIELDLFPSGIQVGGGRGELVWLKLDVDYFLHARFRGCFKKYLNTNRKEEEKKSEEDDED